METRSLLTMVQGNGKLPPSTLIVSLPSGYTCPGASTCQAFADRTSGRIRDGENNLTRCFTASEECQYPNVRESRWKNLELLKACSNAEQMARLIELSIQPHVLRKRRNPARIIRRVRIHEGGDFFSQAYFDAWLEVARRFEDLIFYAYTKSLPFALKRADALPVNFKITASAGGRYDHLLDRFERRAYIVLNQQVADLLELPVDHDDTHAHLLPPGPFAHLVHGVQPAGSEAGRAIKERQQNGAFVGYGKSFVRAA